MSLPLFLQFVREHNINIVPEKTPGLAATVEKAAQVHGVPVPNIVKSLVVKADNEFLVCLCPGSVKLDLEMLTKNMGKKCVRMASAAEVKGVTGHSIGGVPPFGHKRPLRTVIIPGFHPAERLWAAAGAADANFKATLSELEKIVKEVNLMVG